MIKRLFKALAATIFLLISVPGIFFGFASLLTFDLAPLVFMWERLLEFPQFDLSRQLAIILSSVGIFILVAIYSSKEK